MHLYFFKRPIVILFACLIVCLALIAGNTGLSGDYFSGLKNTFLPIGEITPDSNEYAPSGITAVIQIQNAISPRYKKDHTLKPNVLWMSPRYLGGTGQPGITDKKVIQDSKAIMLSLAQRMNYYLILPGNTYGINGYNDTNTVAGSYIDLANKYPNLPAAVIIFWGQIKPRLCGYKQPLPAIISTDFPGNHYVHFNGKKRLSPASPDDSLKRDGLVLRCYLNQLCKNLKRPVQLINENGEVFKHFGKSLLEKDENCVKDKEARNIVDWDEYEATRRLQKEKLVQKQFLDLPCLKDAIYTQYAIDGHRTYRHKYEQVREINSKINHQYYSTPDFYPRWPYNWKTWKGAWHGFKWIADCRVTEISNGDHLYSPFVSPGWDIREDQNIRPGQWLGLLKALGVTGAEFYYPGYFNLKAPYSKPENYIWQSLIPAYAQAITSRYEEILRNGELLNPPLYNLSKRDDELILARKAKGKEIYVISGSIQPTSNQKGSSPLERETEITLGKHNIKFKIRRQGSTYILNLTEDKPVFIQLDEWHEYKHPNKWDTGSIMIDAELFDNKEQAPEIRTRNEDGLNFNSFISYINITKSVKAEYFPEFNSASKTYIWVKVRGENGNLKMLYEGSKKEASINNKDWKWIQVTILKDFKKGEITFEGSNISLDKICFTRYDEAPKE